MGFLKTFYDIFVRFMIFCLPFMMIIVSLYDIFFTFYVTYATGVGVVSCKE